jgi:hypothetical protein
MTIERLQLVTGEQFLTDVFASIGHKSKLDQLPRGRQLAKPVKVEPINKYIYTSIYIIGLY